jgi:O-antigen ligase
MNHNGHSAGASSIFKFFLSTTILAIPFYVFRFSFGPIPSTLLEVLIFVTFILALVGGRLKKIKNFGPLFWAGLFVLAALLAVVFGPNKTAALGIWKAYFFDGFLIFTIFMSLDEKERTKAGEFLVLGGALTALLAMTFYFTGFKTIDGRLLDLDRLSPNYMAMYLVPLFVLNLGAIFKNKDKAKYFYLIVMGIIMATAIFLTNSRGGYIATLAGVIILTLSWLNNKVGKKTAVSLILILLAVMLGFSAWFFKPQANDLGRTGSSSNIRYYIWTTSIKIAKDNPVSGIGLDNFQTYFSNFTKGWTNFDEFITPEAHTAHNLYLQIYLTMGLAGIISFFTLIYSSKFWRSRDLALVAALTSIFIFALFDTPFFRNDLAILFWMILALTHSRRQEK